MELHLGHIHKAISGGAVFATIWPTPTPGMWYISTSRGQATEQPVPTDQVEVVLALWDFHADAKWAHWAGPLNATNPAPEVWAAYRRIGR